MKTLRPVDFERIRAAVKYERIFLSNRNVGLVIHWKTYERLADLGFLRLESWLTGIVVPTDEAIRFIEALDRPEGTEL